MGIERVVESLADLGVMLQVLARSATGQRLSVYTTMVSGPARPGEPDGPEEFHLVLLDNGRSGILGGAYAEALMCIRCGACLNACPVYQSIGGHAYGGVYSGPIGAILTPLLEPDLVDVDQLPQASSLCGACAAAPARRCGRARAPRGGRARGDRRLAGADAQPDAVSSQRPARVDRHAAGGARRAAGLAATAAERMDQLARFSSIRGTLIQRHLGAARRGQ
jgi:ferredoxin